MQEGVRHLALDTETTGMSAEEGDRIVDLGLVEFAGGMVTGRSWQSYFNPQRPVSEEAVAIHGLTDEFLADKPLFAERADEFLEFCAGHEIVIHNAPFDLAFLDAELARVGRPPFSKSFKVRDSLAEARQMVRGNASLDALCSRFGVDNSSRGFHGALLDADLLAEVYMRMHGTAGLAHAFGPGKASGAVVAETRSVVAGCRRPLGVVVPTPDEVAAHEAFVGKIKDAVWASLGDGA